MRPPSLASTLLCAAAFLGSLPARAEDLQFTFYNHGENQNREGGAQRDARLTFDTTRLVLALEGGLPEYGLEAELEVEFEHGGTGSALELEYEEFGEFEQEVEKGGEVLVEELSLTTETVRLTACGPRASRSLRATAPRYPRTCSPLCACRPPSSDWGCSR
jgi:hypothetical protein